MARERGEDGFSNDVFSEESVARHFGEAKRRVLDRMPELG